MPGRPGRTESNPAWTERPDLFQRGEDLLDLCEIGQVLGCGSLLAVPDDAFFVDDEGRAGRRVADSRESREQNVVGTGRLLVEVAGQADGDFFLFGPCVLRKRAVHAHTDNIRVEALVCRKTGGDITKFLRADAGERQRKKEQHGRALPEIRGEGNVLETL